MTTEEAINLESSVVIDTNGVKTPFIRERLLVSVYESCGHRSTALQDAIGLSATVISSCLAKQTSPGIIARDDLVMTTLLCLQRFDKAAGTYYAAYHQLKSPNK